MDQLLLISVVGGATLGILALAIAALVVRLYSNRLARGLDLDLYYQAIDDFKRRVSSESEYSQFHTANTLRTLSIGYTVGVGIIMSIVIRVVVALSPNLGTTALVVLLVWLAVASVPVVVMISYRAKQIVILEIASILERVAQSQDENDELWTIGCSKLVAGGDLFGEDEEDRLDLYISRTEVAPVTLSLLGRVAVAEAGLQRTTKKSGLRQLRIQGWEVNELRETQAEIAYRWSLHDYTYADIAKSIARMVEALGFPLIKVRMGKEQSDQERSRVP
jgi:hypothetical protein